MSQIDRWTSFDGWRQKSGKKIDKYLSHENNENPGRDQVISHNGHVHYFYGGPHGNNHVYEMDLSKCSVNVVECLIIYKTSLVTRKRGFTFSFGASLLEWSLDDLEDITKIPSIRNISKSNENEQLIKSLSPDEMNKYQMSKGRVVNGHRDETVQRNLILRTGVNQVARPFRVPCESYDNDFGIWTEWATDKEYCNENCNRESREVRYCTRKKCNGKQDTKRLMGTKCPCPIISKFEDDEATSTEAVCLAQMKSNNLRLFFIEKKPTEKLSFESHKRSDGLVAFTHRNRFCTSGGYDGKIVKKDIYCMNTQAVWEHFGELTIKRRDHMAVLDPFGGGVLFCGGYYRRKASKWKLFHNDNYAMCESFDFDTKKPTAIRNQIHWRNYRKTSQFNRAQPAYAEISIKDFKGVIVTSGAIADRMDGGIWFLHNVEDNKTITEVGCLRNIRSTRGIYANHDPWKSPYEVGKPDYRHNDQLFVHGDKIFYYYSTNFRLYNFDAFDCIHFGIKPTCLKVLETKIPKRKRGFFVNLRGQLKEWSLTKTAASLTSATKPNLYHHSPANTTPLVISCDTVQYGLWTEWTIDSSHCDKDCHRNELSRRYRNATICEENFEIIPNSDLCRDKRNKNEKKKCACKQFDNAGDVSNLEDYCVMQIGGQNEKNHWRSDVFLFSFSEDHMKLKKILPKYPGKSYLRHKKKRVSGSLSGSASIIFQNEVYISGGSHGVRDYPQHNLWRLRDDKWGIVADMVSARRNHVMSLNPFNLHYPNGGLVVCGGYSYRRKKWFFLHEWNEAKNNFDSVCEVWPGGDFKRFTPIGDKLKKELAGQEIETISRGQALVTTIEWHKNEMIMVGGDVDDKGDDDILMFHEHKRKMQVTRLDSFRRLSSDWLTWRGKNKEGQPNQGAEKVSGGYSDFNHNEHRDQLFTFKKRIYYLVNPSTNSDIRNSIWELDISACLNNAVYQCIRLYKTEIPRRSHGIMFSVGSILLEWIPSARNKTISQLNKSNQLERNSRIRLDGGLSGWRITFSGADQLSHPMVLQCGASDSESISDSSTDLVSGEYEHIDDEQHSFELFNWPKYKAGFEWPYRSSTNIDRTQCHFPFYLPLQTQFDANGGKWHEGCIWMEIGSNSFQPVCRNDPHQDADDSSSPRLLPCVINELGTWSQWRSGVFFSSVRFFDVRS